MVDICRGTQDPEMLGWVKLLSCFFLGCGGIGAHRYERKEMGNIGTRELRMRGQRY